VKVLYVTPGCFDKGGISRYSRYQITALREILGEDCVRVFSLLGPDQESLETPCQVHWHGRGVGLRSKVSLASRLTAGALRFRPDVVWSAHVNLSGLTLAASRLVRAQSVLNT
jgi:phosphatidylinositol alpha-1,6-mannosyltransferase